MGQSEAQVRPGSLNFTHSLMSSGSWKREVGREPIIWHPRRDLGKECGRGGERAEEGEREGEGTGRQGGVQGGKVGRNVIGGSQEDLYMIQRRRVERCSCKSVRVTCIPWGVPDC